MLPLQAETVIAAPSTSAGSGRKSSDYQLYFSSEKRKKKRAVWLPPAQGRGGLIAAV